MAPDHPLSGPRLLSGSSTVRWRIAPVYPIFSESCGALLHKHGREPRLELPASVLMAHESYLHLGRLGWSNLPQLDHVLLASAPATSFLLLPACNEHHRHPGYLVLGCSLADDGVHP